MDHEAAYYGYQTRARGAREPARIAADFGKLSRWYRSRLGSYLPQDRAGARCIDVPCGSGNFLYFLREAGFERIAGHDKDPQQVELAVALGLPAAIGDAFEVLEHDQDGFDLISSLDFVEHLSKDDCLRFLSLCYGHLRPSGLLILRTPCADSPFGSRDIWNDLTHRWGMTANVLRVLLEMNGFTRIRILDERPQPYNLLNLGRLLAFYPARAVAAGFCHLLGVAPPSIWSSSMWGIAAKPAAR